MDFASSLPKAVVSKYSSLKERAIKHYDSEILTVCVAEKFTERKLKPSESLTEFMLDLKALSDKAYGDLSAAARERLVMDQFTKSLHIGIHRQILLHSSLTTSSELLDEALKAEAVELGTRGSPAVAAVSKPEESLLVDAIQKLISKVHQLEQGQSAMVARIQDKPGQYEPETQVTRKYQFQGSSFKCKQKGYMARNSPKKDATCSHCKNPGHQAEDCAIRGKRIADF